MKSWLGIAMTQALHEDLGDNHLLEALALIFTEVRTHSPDSFFSNHLVFLHHTLQQFLAQPAHPGWPRLNVLARVRSYNGSEHRGIQESLGLPGVFELESTHTHPYRVYRDVFRKKKRLISSLLKFCDVHICFSFIKMKIKITSTFSIYFVLLS